VLEQKFKNIFVFVAFAKSATLQICSEVFSYKITLNICTNEN